MWLAVRLLGVPRAFPTAIAGAVLSWSTWFTAHSLQDALAPTGYGEPSSTIALPAALAAAAVSAAVATVVVGPGGRRGQVAVRVALPLALVVLNPAAATWEHSRDEQQRIDDVASAGVTTYQPRIGGIVAGGYRSGDQVRLHYTLREGVDHQFVYVRLMPAAAEPDLCALLSNDLLTPACTTDGTTMRAVYESWTEVAVVRGDTVLHADTFQPGIVGADELLAALRTAPRVTPRELVTTGD